MNHIQPTKGILRFRFQARCSRLETHSEPPNDCSGEVASGCEIGSKLVVSGGDAAPIFEAAEGALDEVSSLVGLRIERVPPFSGWVVGNDRLRASGDEEFTQGIAVVGRIGGTKTAGWQRADQGSCNRYVALLAGGYFECEGTAAAIDNSMDFCRSPASRAADRLDVGPPFPPAAERCALAVVLSIM